MRRLTGPGWRIGGSFASWLLFTFSFLGLFQAAGVVQGLGGFCASGGPYVIETECPEAVVVFAPLGIFGMLGAAAIALILARGFGTPLIVWAWPVLFIGLGIQFAVAIREGDVISLLIGLMFVVMGAVPLVFELRGGVRVLRGSHNLLDEKFAERPDIRRTVYGGNRRDSRGTPEVPATALDWLLSLAILVVATGLGAWLSITAFNAVAVAA